MASLCLAPEDMQWNKDLVGMFMEEQKTRVSNNICPWVFLGSQLCDLPSLCPCSRQITQPHPHVSVYRFLQQVTVRLLYILGLEQFPC